MDNDLQRHAKSCLEEMRAMAAKAREKKPAPAGWTKVGQAATTPKKLTPPPKKDDVQAHKIRQQLKIVEDDFDRKDFL